MFGTKKIKINNSVYEKAEYNSVQKGFSDVQEYIEFLINQDTEKSDDTQDSDNKKIEDQLKGLGYIS
jgi:hypothetical protein